MVASYNGWVASRNPADFGDLDNRVIPSTVDCKYSPGVRAGDVATIAFWWGWQWNVRVERLVNPGNWGFFFKQSANSAALLSCHSGGTAWDTDAPAHPNGVHGTLKGPSLIPGKTKAQVVDDLMAELRGVVYSGKGAWGGGTVDEMHAEIAEGTSVEAVQSVAAYLVAKYGPIDTWGTSAQQPAVPVPDPVNVPVTPPASGVAYSEAVRRDQFNLNDTGFSPGAIDGYPGTKTTDAAKRFQFAARITVDGVIGDGTRAMLKRVPSWHGAPDVAGDGGHSAGEWQRQLANHGWHITVDGQWGDHSASILRQFQVDKGITADGQRGPQSWTTLHCTNN